MELLSKAGQGCLADDFLQNLWGAGGSTVSLPLLATDPDTQDFLSRLSEHPDCLQPAVPDVAESSAAAVGPAGATAFGPAGAAGPFVPAAANCFPRVASLDFIRTVLTARQGAAGSEAGDGASTAGATDKAPGTEGPQLLLTDVKAEPACSSVADTTAAVPPEMPTGTAAQAGAPAPAPAPALPFAAAMVPPLAAATPPLQEPPGMPPAFLAALMHGSLAGAPLADTTATFLNLPAVPVLVPASGPCGDALLPLPLPLPLPGPSATPTLTGGRSTGCGQGGSSGTASPGSGAAAGAAMAAINPAGLSKAELRRQRRMVSNRESARRSRKRKQEVLGDMEARVREVQGHLATANARVAHLSEELARRDRDLAMLRQEMESMSRLLPTQP